MFPVIGSGGFITAPVITNKGEPIYDPIVLQETNLGKNLYLLLQETVEQTPFTRTYNFYVLSQVQMVQISSKILQAVDLWTRKLFNGC